MLLTVKNGLSENGRCLFFFFDFAVEEEFQILAVFLQLKIVWGLPPSLVSTEVFCLSSYKSSVVAG